MLLALIQSKSGHGRSVALALLSEVAPPGRQLLVSRLTKSYIEHEGSAPAGAALGMGMLMGERDTDGDAIAERRAFVQRLDAHEDVRRVDFTRDGFRTVLVGFEPDAESPDQWHRTAIRLGYTVEQRGTDASWPGCPADAWILRLTAPEGSTKRGGGGPRSGAS